ncbi:outer membrane lipoprotein [Klebsiella grimontii]|uniref:Outer membrane lipoprotein n=2 Tax=Klebsiella grimontii TaxID=2058152 RepID=A0A7H4PBZ6_9ENTR|nr:outer membrane lipoprotein [Klebsiella grimontii]
MQDASCIYSLEFIGLPLAAALFLMTACSWVDSYSSTAYQQLLVLVLEELICSSSAMQRPRRSTDNDSGKKIARFVSKLAWR